MSRKPTDWVDALRKSLQSKIDEARRQERFKDYEADGTKRLYYYKGRQNGLIAALNALDDAQR